MNKMMLSCYQQINQIHGRLTISPNRHLGYRLWKKKKKNKDHKNANQTEETL